MTRGPSLPERNTFIKETLLIFSSRKANTKLPPQHTHPHICTHLQRVELGAQLTNGLHVLLIALLHLQQFGCLDNGLELVHNPRLHQAMAATPFLQLTNVVPGRKDNTNQGFFLGRGGGGGGGKKKNTSENFFFPPPPLKNIKNFFFLFFLY